jgi:F-type H+-transporting ATPase subunit gamma
MANTKDIRAKIASTIKTQQTTKAMKMVSAAKLRRAQLAIVNARPYARKIAAVIQTIASSGRVEHPLLSDRGPELGNSKRLLLVVLTSDRGLCGGFNGNIIKYTRAFVEKNRANYQAIDFIFIGRKGADYFKRLGVVGIDSILNLTSDIRYDLASKVAEKILHAYLADESQQRYDEVRLIYNEFKSAIAQDVVDEQLLPVKSKVLAEEAAGEKLELGQEVIFEPTPDKMIEQLLRKHFTIQIYRCMQESVASEHGARMSAMENATKNAGEMIRSLTLTYNKIRQAAITTELIEITSGAEALKN